MLKYISKIFIIITIISLFSLNFLIVNAEPAEGENESSETTSEELPEETDETVEEENTEGSSDDIHTEESSEPVGQVQQSSVDSMAVTSVRNINGLPEANLELNNILNIILIAIGVLLILLAIALLIKIKK